MRNFTLYYQELQKVFDFRLKFAFEIDDEAMDKIERVLDKYRPEKISKPKKMMFQTTPLGFIGLKNKEIYYVDAGLTVPGNSRTIAYALCVEFGFPTDSPLISVENEEESYPIVDAEEASARQEAAKEKGSLLSQPNYPERPDTDVADYFGDEYNKRFMAYLKTVSEERNPKKVDPTHPITKWDKQPDPKADLIDTSNFNDRVGIGNKPFKARTYPKSPKEDQ